MPGLRLRALLGLVFAALALGGCDPNLGVHGELNINRVIKAITDQTRLEAGVPAAITCPDHVMVKQGAQFNCAAHFSVGHVRFTVVQVDAQGHVRYVFQPYKILNTSGLTLHLEQQLSTALHRPVVVVCPQPVVDRAGVNFTCLSAKKDGTRRRIVVTQTGTVSGPTFAFL
jgi:hypothetical protein